MELQDLLSGALTEKIGKNVGVDSDAVGSILQSALPTLLSSMNKNSSTKGGAESLTKALFDHADDDDDVDNVDQEDGAKVIDHILGDKADTIKNNLSKVAGNIDTEKVGKILAIAGPLLLGSLGSQAKKKKEEAESGFDVTDLLGGLIGSGSGNGFDIGSLLGLGGDESTSKKSTSKKTTSKKTTAKKNSKKKAAKEDDGFGLDDLSEAADTVKNVGSILGSLFGKKK